MQYKKNDRPSVGAPGRSEESGVCETSHDSTSNDTTSSPPGQAVHIADFLLPGQQSAVPLRYLKDLLHLDGRKVRLMIRAERLAGTPILESSKATGGYYLPGNAHERARCVQRLRRRAAEIIKVADAIEQGGRQIE